MWHQNKKLFNFSVTRISIQQMWSYISYIKNTLYALGKQIYLWNSLSKGKFFIIGSKIEIQEDVFQNSGAPLPGKIFRCGPLFQFLFSYDPYEHVVLSSHQDVYDRLKRVRFVWLGEYLPRGTKLCERAKLVRSINQLQHYQQELNKEETVMLFYYQNELTCPTILEKLKSFTNMKLYPVKDYQNIDIQFSKVIYCNKSKNLFPNFCELSTNNKAQINRVKYNLYWMLAWQNFHKARDDFLKFYKYYVQKQGKIPQKNKIQIEEMENSYRSVLRDKYRQIENYTNETFFYKVLNNSLRSLTNPMDFAHIRFPFRLTFFTIVQLFIEQKNQIYRQDGFTCYRGCYLSKEQFERLSKSKGKYIQMNMFLSASFKEQVARAFNNQNLIIIKVPPIKQIHNFFHSFADISKLSLKEQSQIIFNPFNVFKVLKTFKKGATNIVELEYTNVEQLSKNGKNLSQNDLNLIQNYDHQKSMLSLNRNQGQYLWKLWQEGAHKFYKQKLINLFLNQNKIVPKSHPTFQIAKAERYFLKEIKQFTEGYDWDKNEESNLQFLSHFSRKYEYKTTQMHFHIGKFLQNQLNFQRSLSFMSLCYNVARKLFSLDSSFNWTFLTNVGIALTYLDQYPKAGEVLERARYLFQNNCKVYKSNYPYIIFAAVMFYQTGDKHHFNKIYTLLQNCVKKMQPRRLQNHPWLNLLNNLDNLQHVKNFQKYFEKTFDKVNIYLRKLLLFKIQQLIQQTQTKLLGIQANKFNSLLSQNDLDQLKIGTQLLNDYNPNGQIETTLIQTLLELCNFYLHGQKKQVQEIEQMDEIQLDQNQMRISKYYYYQIRLHIMNEKYRLRLISEREKKLTVKHLYWLQRLCFTKFKKCYYLHFCLALVIMEYIMNCGNFVEAVKLVKFIKAFRAKIEMFFIFDKKQLKLQLLKLKSQVKQIKASP